MERAISRRDSVSFPLSRREIKTKRRQTMNYNPSYIAYAKTQGKTPEKMFEKDQEYGMTLISFHAWLIEMKEKFFIAHPEHFLFDVLGHRDRYCIAHHDKWIEFLHEQTKANEQCMEQ